MDIGSKLKNGAIVLDSKPVNEYDYGVLALSSRHSHPYGTWLVDANNTPRLVDRFNTLTDALASFNSI